MAKPYTTLNVSEVQFVIVNSQIILLHTYDLHEKPNNGIYNRKFTPKK